MDITTKNCLAVGQVGFVYFANSGWQQLKTNKQTKSNQQTKKGDATAVYKEKWTDSNWLLL